MIDAEYLDGIATHTIDNSIRQSGDHEFSCLKPPPRPSHVGKSGQIQDACLDLAARFFSGRGIIQPDKFPYLMKIEDRQL
jgi:hypothetical protein